jgi:2-oxoglutarate dehydrogenase E1 component
VLASSSPLKLRNVIEVLKNAYCGGIGVEFMHIADMDQQNWIRDKFEKQDKFQHTKADILKMADRLVFACNFETFLATKYGVTKRFGLEGLEAMIPGFKAIIDTAAELGCENFTIGMPHRGRLNVLANVMHKPMEEILEEFISGTIAADEKHDQVLGSGDVKYHLGYSNDRRTRSGKTVHLSLVANPSHLEAANTVVLGKTRAKQHYLSDERSRRKAMSVLLHGDAAFAGQGIVWETLAMSDIKGYTTGGTVHIIVNNQIGFTTDPRFARSSPYSTDVAKSVGAPIFHVNADDLEAVCWVCSTAAEFRQKFGKDVVVDIVGYRRYGHNEIDEPTFTQPFMYSRIAQTPTVLQKFKQLELTKGLLSKEECDAIEAHCLDIFEKAFATARKNIEMRKKNDSRPPLMSSWQNMKDRFSYSAAQETGVDTATLLKLGEKLSTVPADFNIHRGLKRVMEAKAKMFATQQGIDWATAEALAFGSLLLAGTHVRLSGQDVERGTFSHRHAVLHDQENESLYTPLQNLAEKQAALAIFNSNLSEYGVLGFELGYSLQNPNSLVIWEAQFGDFCNTAQVIIDQFIASGEQKWLRQSGLVMLLPHGYEGQGPEHSSARMERFLQMSDEDAAIVPDSKGGKESMQIQRSNWQIVNVTTPANYFHVLRRQVCRGLRKLLEIFSNVLSRVTIRRKHTGVLTFGRAYHWCS